MKQQFFQGLKGCFVEQPLSEDFNLEYSQVHKFGYMKIGEILLRKKLVSPNQLNRAIGKQGETRQKLGEVLLEDSLISSDDLDMALKEQYWRKNGFWVIG